MTTTTRSSAKYFLLLSSSLATLATATTASAQTVPGFAVDRFEPSERGSDWFANESLDLRGKFRPAIGVVGDYAYRPLVVYAPDGSVLKSPVRNMLFAHVGASAVLFDRLRLAANMPVQLFADGHTASVGSFVYPSPPHEQGLGDLRFGADLRLFGTYGGPITGALGAQVWIPTGDRAQYSSDGEVRVRPRAMVAGDIGIFTYAVQANVAYRARSESVGSGSIGSEVGFTAAAGLRLANKKLTVGPEVFGTTVLDDAFAKRTTPMEGILGAHYLAGGSVRFGGGVGTGLTRGFGAPEVRGLLSIEWVAPADRDADGDGVFDAQDACPDQPGIRTSDPSTNGCPMPDVVATPDPDRDHDGIKDEDDACADLPGVRSDDPKKNGCPADTDGDGIEDAKDACPAVAGVATDDPKTNGCPADADGDGVLDADDACPSVPGLKTDDPKTNGCPDPDRDKDGVLNDQDACPDEPGPKNKDPKRNGCPKAFIQEGSIKILDQVKFKTGSAQIETGKDSQEVLEAVLKVMKEHPEIKKVRVEGHTDNKGSAKLNTKLSADRAAAVVKWLVGHGIEADRLASAGFGPDRPIDDNGTEAGRRMNRRVEFQIEP